MKHKLIIKIWKAYIVDPYLEEIKVGNFDFFIQKNYVTDLNDFSYNEKALKGIESIRAPISEMPKEDQDKCMLYVKNLSKLCIIYLE